MINPNTKVVPIDHGWANMKTEQDVFTSGVSEITTEPALFNDVLEYNNKYYKIGGKRLEVKEDKVHDDNYYLLTLAATAVTLERLHIRDAHVLWAVGLPLTRFGEEKDDFIKYLMRDKEVTFKYNKIQYHIVVEKVSVYPQCYAAVSDKLRFFDNKVLVVDIGSWTVDIMPIINSNPDESICVTKPAGIITCIQQINKECVRQLNAEVDEYDIQKVMMKGGEHLPKNYREIIEKELRAYCNKIYHYIRELGYNMELTPIIFVGGGAGVMKRYGDLHQPNITYIEDICANAKGYATLASGYLKVILERQAGGDK